MLLSDRSAIINLQFLYYGTYSFYVQWITFGSFRSHIPIYYINFSIWNRHFIIDDYFCQLSLSTNVSTYLHNIYSRYNISYVYIFWSHFLCIIITFALGFSKLNFIFVQLVWYGTSTVLLLQQVFHSQNLGVF